MKAQHQRLPQSLAWSAPSPVCQSQGPYLDRGAPTGQGVSCDFQVAWLQSGVLNLPSKSEGHLQVPHVSI